MKRLYKLLLSFSVMVILAIPWKIQAQNAKYNIDDPIDKEISYSNNEEEATYYIYWECIILYTIFQYCFALLLCNSAVLFGKRNGLPLMVLSFIACILVPPLRASILHKNLITMLYIVCFLFGGTIEILGYYFFLRKKMGNVAINQHLKPCKWWFILIIALPIIVLDYLGPDWQWYLN